jgi:hypothetical protein
MTKLLFIAATLSLGLVGSVRADQISLAPEAGMELFLLIGQSNMAGRGRIEPQDKVPIPRVWMLNKQDEWAPAVDPLHYDKPKIAGVGIGRSFAKAVADARPNVQIGLIPCAVGGTSIDQWKKGGKLYEEAMRRAKVAMKRGKIAAILWHQGESDSGTPEKRAAYAAKLEKLISNLREDLNAPDAPFVLGQLGPFHAEKVPGSKDMDDVLLAFPKTHPNTACATSEGLTDVGDQTHFDAKSLREFGKRYAEKYLSLTRVAAVDTSLPPRGTRSPDGSTR